MLFVLIMFTVFVMFIMFTVLVMLVMLIMLSSDLAVAQFTGEECPLAAYREVESSMDDAFTWISLQQLAASFLKGKCRHFVCPAVLPLL